MLLLHYSSYRYLLNVQYVHRYIITSIIAWIRALYCIVQVQYNRGRVGEARSRGAGPSRRSPQGVLTSSRYIHILGYSGSETKNIYCVFPQFVIIHICISKTDSQICYVLIYRFSKNSHPFLYKNEKKKIFIEYIVFLHF